MANQTKKKNRAHALFQSRKKPPNFFLSVVLTSFKMLCIVICVLGVSVGGLVLGMAKGYYDTTPELNTAEIDDQNLTSFIYDVNGELITSYRGSENRVWASIDEIPKMLQNAFVALEDARFWTHNGIDLKRMVGAFVSNISGGSTQGGSTITQQLIKLRVLSTEVSYKRKLQEAYLAIELEQEYEKDQILESYLNSIWLGGSNYGIKAAAMDYFGKELDELTLKECAMLAGITKSPSSYNPRSNYYTRNTPEVSEKRTARALYAMLENNYITKEEYDAALDETVQIVETSTGNSLYPMPYAVETVLADVESAFLQMRGIADTSANRRAIRAEIQSNGYNIYSTIDAQIQSIAEDVIYNWDRYPALADSSDAVVRSVSASGVITETEQPQAATVLYDHQSGEIRAVVGGRDAPTQFLQLNRALSSAMPVGSSIKPIAVYAPALDLGNSPASITENMEIPIPGWSTAKGYPANSSSNTPSLITLRQAMVKSLNIASAHTLLDYVGIETSCAYLTAMGIQEDHLNKDAFGLALGSSGISPYEMAVAYGVLAHNGVYQQPLSFTRVTDSKGNVILDMKAQQEASKTQVFQESTAYLITDMLVNAVNSGTGTNARINGVTVGGKTGTHSDYYGVFFAGITPHYSCSVWVGHDNYKALYRGATGGKEAVPIFQAIVSRVYAEKSLDGSGPIMDESPESLGLVQAETCSLTGLLATEACRLDPNYQPVTDWWRAGEAPQEYCCAHQLVSLCDQCGRIANSYSPSSHWECQIVISPAMPIYKYTNEILAPFFPGALRSPLDPQPYGVQIESGVLTPESLPDILTPDIPGSLTPSSGDSNNTALWERLDGAQTTCTCSRIPFPDTEFDNDSDSDTHLDSFDENPWNIFGFLN